MTAAASAQIEPQGFRGWLPRRAIQIAYLVTILNLANVLHINAANVVEKGCYLVAAFSCMLLRPVNRGIVGLLCACTFMVLVLGALSANPDFSWATAIFSLNQFVIIYALLAFHPTPKDCDSFLMTAALVPIGCALLGMVYQVAGLHPLWATEWGVGTLRFEGSLIPAFLSGLSMCGTFAALNLLLGSKRAIIYPILLADLMVLALAGGRAPLAVCLVCCAAALLLTRRISPAAKVYGVLGGLTLLLLMAATVGQTVVERFLTSSDNGRALMWAYLQTVADLYPWAGIGWGHEFFYVPHEISVQTGSTAAHNDYLRLLVEIGHIGMPLFYLFLALALLISASRGRRYPDFLAIIAFGGFLFLSRTDNALAAPSHFPLFIMATLVAFRDREAARAAAQIIPSVGAKGRRDEFRRIKSSRSTVSHKA